MVSAMTAAVSVTFAMPLAVMMSFSVVVAFDIRVEGEISREECIHRIVRTACATAVKRDSRFFERVLRTAAVSVVLST